MTLLSILSQIPKTTGPSYPLPAKINRGSSDSQYSIQRFEFSSYAKASNLVIRPSGVPLAKYS